MRSCFFSHSSKCFLVSRKSGSLAACFEQSTTYAGRLLLGYSWLFRKRAFAALGLGVSMGRATGTRVTDNDDNDPPMTERFLHRESEVELYARIGVALGL